MRTTPSSLILQRRLRLTAGICLALALLSTSCASDSDGAERSSVEAAVAQTEVPDATSSTLGSSAAEEPTNDALDDATVIDPASLPFIETVTTTGATTDDDDSALGCPAPATDASVWYSITPATDVRLLVSGLGTTYSWGISAATERASSLNLIECRPYAFVVEAEAGTTYFLQVFDGQEDGRGTGGDLRFSIQELPEAPANDRFEDAIVIDPSSLPFTDSVDTTGATTDEVDFELGCPAPATDASIWYSITPLTDMRLVVSAEGSDFAWGLGVGTGVPGAFGDGECKPEPLTVDAKAGVTYMVHVFDGQEDGEGNGGNLELTVEQAP